MTETLAQGWTWRRQMRSREPSATGCHLLREAARHSREHTKTSSTNAGTLIDAAVGPNRAARGQACVESECPSKPSSVPFSSCSLDLPCRMEDGNTICAGEHESVSSSMSIVHARLEVQFVKHILMRRSVRCPPGRGARGWRRMQAHECVHGLQHGLFRVSSWAKQLSIDDRERR